MSKILKGRTEMKKRIIPFILMLSLILTTACMSQTVLATHNDAGMSEAEINHHAGREHARWLAAISVQIDSEFVEFEDQRPTIVDDRTLVPVRGVFEHVGFNVDWNPISQQATLTSDDFEVILTIGSAEFTTNGVAHTLDVPAQIINDRTMLPIRAVMESVGYYVGWDGRSRTVLISSTPMTYVTIRGEQLNTAIMGLVLDFDQMTNEEFALIAQLTNLTHLWIGDSQVCDLTPIAELTSLVELSVQGAIASDLTPLTGLTNLTWLSIFGNHISDITPLTNLTNLTHLEIADTQLSDISPLSNLKNLTTLDVTTAQISNITPLANLTNLEALSLRHNQIVDLAPLANLTNLNSLGLNDNQISDLAPIANLTNLRSLGLGNNQIVDLASLSNLPDLGFLCLNYNQISDLSPLAGMTSLWSVDLYENPVTDWSPVAHVQWVSGRPE